MAQYRRRAQGYDAELTLFEPIRNQSIALLGLQGGDTVLDVGCGTGLSFEGLHHRVGSKGRIVGIEQCPEMMEKARSRVQEHHWPGVDLICAPAALARVPVKADAALFHFTHDIVREEAAIANILSYLKRGARVVSAGLQWAAPWMWPTNGFVLMAATYSVTSLEGLSCPWDRLSAHLRDVEVRTTAMGGIYIANGVYEE